MISATNGREALEIAQRERPDLVIMDVMMAEMDGLTALRHLKKIEGGKDLPVVVFTANANIYDTLPNESELSGATLFLTKPVSPGQILQEIQRLLPPQTDKSAS